MGGDSLEQLWYGLCLIKAVVTLFVVSFVVLPCKQFLRSIFWNRDLPRSTKTPDGAFARHRAACSESCRSRSWQHHSYASRAEIPTAEEHQSQP